MQISNAAVGFSSQLYSSAGVIRGSDVMSNSNLVFVGSTDAVGGAGGPTCQIVNPAGSGKKVFVDGFDFYQSANGSVLLFGNAAQAATSNGLVVGLNLNGTNGVTQRKSDTVNVAGGGRLLAYAGLAFQQVQVRLPFPIVLEEADTLSLLGAAAGTILSCNWFVREF
jgi:hypothetical protein